MILLFCRAMQKERNLGLQGLRSSPFPTTTLLARSAWPGLSAAYSSIAEASRALASAHETGDSEASIALALNRSCASVAIVPWLTSGS
jgi:hypothetical protein